MGGGGADIIGSIDAGPLDQITGTLGHTGSIRAVEGGVPEWQFSPSLRPQPTAGSSSLANKLKY